MEALLMEQMSYGGGGAGGAGAGGVQGGQVGAVGVGVAGGGGAGGGGLGLVHPQGDYAPMNWFDGMLSVLHGDLGPERSPHSTSSPYVVVTDDVGGGVVDVSTNSVPEQHHSPTDSSYNDGSLSSIESSSSAHTGGNHAVTGAGAAAPKSTTSTMDNSVVNGGWVDVATGSLYSSGGEFLTPLPPGGGFGGRSTGTSGTTPQQLYSTAAVVVPENSHVHLTSEQQQERKPSFQQQEISPIYDNISTGRGRPIKSGLPQSAGNVNEGSPTSNFSRDGSVASSINRSRGFTNSNINGEGYGGSQLASPGAGNVNNSNSSRSNFVESPAAAHALEYKSSSSRHMRSQQQQQQHHPHQRMPTAEVWSNRPGVHQQQRQYHAQQLQQHHQQQQQQQQEVSQLQQSSEPEQHQQQQQEQQPEDSGLWLVHSLVLCAQFIQRGDIQSAKSALMKINQVLLAAPPQQLPTGPMSRVASYFADALKQRIYGNSPSSQEAFLLAEGLQPGGVSELLHVHFYEMCPYLKFAHFTANQAILEACKGAKYVHVIDFNLSYGLQWPPLIQALALRHGGPPILRLTGIGPPSQGEMAVNEIGKNLAQLANGVKVQFEFRGVVAYKLNDIKPWMLQVHPDEVVVVNSTMQLHKLLHTDEPNPNPTNTAASGLGAMLSAVRNLNPKIFTVAEQEANHNCPNFLDRFIEALHFYSAIFDSIEASNFPAGSVQQTLAEMHLGREISNILACEGEERVERHEPLDQWRVRLHNSGFQPIRLGLDAFKQASVLLTMFPGQGYRVEDHHGCLTLYWHARPLISASAWVCARA